MTKSRGSLPLEPYEAEAIARVKKYREDIETKTMITKIEKKQSRLEQRLLQIQKGERAERRCCGMEAEMLVALVDKLLYFEVDVIQGNDGFPPRNYVGFLDSVGNNFLKFRNVIPTIQTYNGYSQKGLKEEYERSIKDGSAGTVYDSIDEFVANQGGQTIIRNKRGIVTLIELK